MNSFADIIHNPVLVSSVIAWLLAQVIKIFTHYLYQGRLDFRRMVGSGGMPSSHSSAVTCATLMTGLVEGFDSTLFGVAFVFAIIVMYDAAGVRRAAGKQAKVLNELVRDFYEEHNISQEKLKELLGHSPVEVLAGAVLGVLIALVYYYWIVL